MLTLTGHCKSGRKIAGDFQALHHIFSVVLVSQCVRRYVRHMEDLGFFSSHLIIMMGGSLHMFQKSKWTL